MAATNFIACFALSNHFFPEHTHLTSWWQRKGLYYLLCFKDKHVSHFTYRNGTEFSQSQYM